MLTTRRQPVLPPSKGLWFPGQKTEGFSAIAPMESARAKEIARSRDELLGLLHNLPESEFELSLTDLVERTPAREQKLGSSGASQQAKGVTMEPRGSNLGSSRRGKRSRSDGVLLNMYIPRSLSRSFTWPWGGRGEKETTSNIRTRAKESSSTGCWPAMWHKGWGNVKRK